jgi:cytochrome c553
VVKTRIALFIGACLLAGQAAAATPALVGNPQAGQAKTVVCGACHGADGNSLAPTFPKLAGQHEKYLLKQLHDVKSGARVIAVMAGQLDALTEQDLADIAAYYAAQTTTPGAAKEELIALGESIYRAGIRERGIAACAACHSPTGAGNGPAKFPVLSGQHAEYLASSLRAWRSEERKNDGDTRIMRDVAAHLTDKELDAVASYASGLH